MVDEEGKHKENKVVRCEWLNKDKLYIKYHDEEWGIPQYDSLLLFEMLCLEGQQAGLSWITILKKRNNYRRLFCNFNPTKISQFNSKDINVILSDSGIVRHKGKVLSIIQNAISYLKMKKNGEDFSKFVWSFVENKPLVNNWKNSSDIPTQTPTSVALSKALKKREFRFVGPTTCYSFMQACGLVNDHIVNCISRNISTKQY
ncbi:DNA-3-methyladenine glycosylase 1 [Manduca sexta]|uniref:DNA-3-methyladenine glycosylase 1 n=1 Tax=Manduca sexta TaxID=7130 RepID=UPI00188F2AE1|nr:DNA-3-methyladenine glycosylase 1 [Manduca sexta]XP_030037506.2 DNA-3-methyladenine glycosylase 1 [Manduca sexta]